MSPREVEEEEQKVTSGLAGVRTAFGTPDTRRDSAGGRRAVHRVRPTSEPSEASCPWSAEDAPDLADATPVLPIAKAQFA